MKKLNSTLSLIAVLVAVIMLLPSDAKAQHHAPCNHGILAKSKKCPVLGCGTIGKCAHCRQVERRAKANCAKCRLRASTPAVATPAPSTPMAAPVPTTIHSVAPSEPVVIASPAVHPVVGTPPTVLPPITSAPIVDTPIANEVVSGPVDLPSCGLPSVLAPAPSCDTQVEANLSTGIDRSTCDAGGRSTTSMTCSQFYSANLGCDGGSTVAQVDVSPISSCDSSISSPSGLCDGGSCSQTCDSGSQSCGGSCGGYGEVEMTFAESLWADVCCEPYRTNYCSIFGGFGEIEDFYPTEVVPSRGSFDDGWIAGISKGRFLTKCLRAELEYTFREGNAEELVVGGVPESWEGDLQVHALMFNAVFQLNYGPMAYISPYYGAGVGVAYFDSDITGLGGNLSLDDTKLAWQGLFGINVALSQGIDLFGEYRVMRTSELDLVDSVSGAALGTTDPEFNTYLVGLRFYR